MRKQFLVFGSPLIEQPEIDEVVCSLKSGWIGTGPKVKKFEEMFAATANAVIHAGGVPVFVDCEKDTRLFALVLSTT